MSNVFENIWFLLTVAGVVLVIASIVRQTKPEWGYWPLLAPLAVAALAFGLDALVKTDTEAINEIVAGSKQAVVDGNVRQLMSYISPDYADAARRQKAAFEDAAGRTINNAAVTKIKTQSHLLTVKTDTAESRLNFVIHFDRDSRYAAMGTLMFLGVTLNYEKIGDRWFISSAAVDSVNNEPYNW